MSGEPDGYTSYGEFRWACDCDERMRAEWTPVWTRQPASAGIAQAAAHVQKKADDYAAENCSMEADTGAAVYHYGAAGMEYHHTLIEIAEELENLASTQGQPAAQEWMVDALVKLADDVWYGRASIAAAHQRVDEIFDAARTQPAAQGGGQREGLISDGPAGAFYVCDQCTGTGVVAKYPEKPAAPASGDGVPTIRTWRERLAGLDKPTDFAIAEAAKEEARELRNALAALSPTASAAREGS